MPGSDKRRATEAFTFRMTPADAEVLRAAAAAAGLPAPVFARRAVFKAAALPAPVYEAKAPHPVKADIARLLGQINRIGSNINQLARLANAAGTVPASLDAVLDELRQIRTDLKGVAV